jgi:hypothetical protein
VEVAAAVEKNPCGRAITDFNNLKSDSPKPNRRKILLSFWKVFFENSEFNCPLLKLNLV